MSQRRYLESRYVTPKTLIKEGVVELGRIGAVAFVLTNEKLRLFHVDSIPSPGTRDTPMPEDLKVSAIDVEAGR